MQGFRVADIEISAGRQSVIEIPGQLPLDIIGEIDHHVSAENHINVGIDRSPPGVVEVHVRKIDQ